MSNKPSVSRSLNIERLDGQTWEEAYRADQRFWRLPKAQRTALLALAKKKDKQATQTYPESEPLPPPPETTFTISGGMTPEEATREKIKRDAELYPVTTASPLKDLPVHELARLVKWMVPPSRKQELREYLAQLRRKSVAAKDAQSAVNQSPKPGERWSDPRGYWTRKHYGNSSAGNQSPTPSQAPSKAVDTSIIQNSDSALGAKTQKRPQESPISAQYRALLETLREAGSDTRDEISTMNARQLQDCLLSDEFHALPETLRKAVTDRYLMLENISTESFWQDLEEK